MKLNTKIRRDSHGPYVRTNGSVYRPQLCKWSYPVMQPMWRDAWEIQCAKGNPQGIGMCRQWEYEANPDLFNDGEPVHVRMVSQTPYCVVETEDGRKAYWWTHGQYQGNKTEHAWAPGSQR